MVRENGSQVVQKRICYGGELYLGGNLSLQFRSKVCHQAQFIVYVVGSLATAQILVHQGAANHGRAQE